MIQRIQSVYLALAAILGLITLRVPAWKFVYGNETEMVNALQMYSPLDTDGSLRSRWFFLTPAHTAWFSLLVVTVLFLLYIIFQYKNRIRQMKLCWIALILQGAQILASMLLILSGPQWVMGGKANTGTPFVGFGMMAVSLFLIWMASKAIKKDEALVKSVDRLR
ncbi:MAG: DUF4293 domain-containing protein [Bacteroidia bacterium]|nr:DUF4293 domain-containing protein [Bacteroidia bacterium]